MLIFTEGDSRRVGLRRINTDPAQVLATVLFNLLHKGPTGKQSLLQFLPGFLLSLFYHCLQTPQSLPLT
jgi:hypothetical protein